MCHYHLLLAFRLLIGFTYLILILFFSILKYEIFGSGFEPKEKSLNFLWVLQCLSLSCLHTEGSTLWGNWIPAGIRGVGPRWRRRGKVEFHQRSEHNRGGVRNSKDQHCLLSAQCTIRWQLQKRSMQQASFPTQTQWHRINLHLLFIDSPVLNVI